MLAGFPFFGLVCHCCTLVCTCLLFCNLVLSVQCTGLLVYLSVGTTGRRKRFIRSTNQHKPSSFLLSSLLPQLSLGATGSNFSFNIFCEDVRTIFIWSKQRHKPILMSFVFFCHFTVTICHYTTKPLLPFFFC